MKIENLSIQHHLSLLLTKFDQCCQCRVLILSSKPGALTLRRIWDIQNNIFLNIYFNIILFWGASGGVYYKADGGEMTGNGLG